MFWNNTRRLRTLLPVCASVCLRNPFQFLRLLRIPCCLYVCVRYTLLLSNDTTKAPQNVEIFKSLAHIWFLEDESALSTLAVNSKCAWRKTEKDTLSLENTTTYFLKITSTTWIKSQSNLICSNAFQMNILQHEKSWNVLADKF